MTTTDGDFTGAHGPEESHGESHASMSDQKSRGKSRVDTHTEFPQVRKSRAAEEKVTAPLPRKVTFSALSLRGPNVTREGEGDQKPNPAPADPEPVADIAERVLDDLAARQRTALDRLRRQTPAIRTRKDQQ